MEQQQREKNTTALEWFDALVFALTVVMFLLLFVMRTVNVEGVSMEPTLMGQDQLLARSFLYTPKRGDIVVVDAHTRFGKPLVKRVIATGGDTINIDFEKGYVFVNGTRLEEDYISDLTTRSFDVAFPQTVPEGELFLMGDNRPYSKDSRSTDIGFIDERDILGKVILRILPIQSFGGVK